MPLFFKQRYFYRSICILLSFFAFNSTHSQCLTPSNLTTSNVLATSCTVNWATTVADSFLVRYFPTGTTAFSYKIVSSSTATSTGLAGLLPGTAYSWQVRTWCNNGVSGAYQTTPAQFTTSQQYTSCVTPNQTSTSSITSSTATLSWNPFITADSFQVRYRVSGTSNYRYIRIPGNQYSLTLTGLSSFTAYEWVVKCVCSSSPLQLYSISNSFRTLAGSCGTPDVAYFSTTNKTTVSATVGWRNISGATAYNVRYAVRYSGNWIYATSNTNSLPISGLQPSTWYEFQVQSVCPGTFSSWSLSGIFQTNALAVLLTRGPYLQQANHNSIFIRWRTNTAVPSKVSYGITPSNLISSVTISSSTTEHIVQLTGLQSNTRYYYSVGTTTTTLLGDTGCYFNTHPVIGSTVPVRIWVTGDMGTGYTSQLQVRDAYASHCRATNTHTNVWLWLGDNAYVSGLDIEYQANVFNIYPYQLRKWVAWPATGNHDLYSASSSSQSGPYFDSFTLPTNGEAGGRPSGTEAYYSFNYANIHFVCLESTGSSFRSASGAQATWLANDLANNTQRWTIVYFHHPPYSKGSHDSDAEVELIEMRTNIIPILESYKVDLVLSGHSHAYERSYLLKGHFGPESTFSKVTMAIDSGSGIFPASYIKSSPSFLGTVYTVCGVSGKVSSTLSGWPHNAMFTSTNSYFGSMIIDVNGDRLDAKFQTSTGTFLDQFTIQKQGRSMYGPQSSDEDGSADHSFNSSIHPNPVTEQSYVLFEMKKASKVRMEVYDMAGGLRFSDEFNLPEGNHKMPIRFPVADLPK
ncbi:MAG: fibronectin type III domain-containing protein, partial [Bacteroidota bacterium]